MKPTNRNDLVTLLIKHKFNLKKALGQNYLIDENIALKIINKVIQDSSYESDRFLEIGSGAGALTYFIKQRIKDLTVIEKDARIVPVFKEFLNGIENDCKLRIIEEDVLDVNLNDVIDDNTICYGNLPYNISTKIISNMLALKTPPKKMVFLVQKEVACRLVAEPKTKDYSYLTMMTDLYCDKKILFHVSKNVFEPMPKVESSLVLLSPKKQFYDERVVRMTDAFLKLCFSHRRKKINHSLKLFFTSLIDLQNELKKESIDTNKRIEEFAVNDVMKIIELSVILSIEPTTRV